ncbi:MAG TPA: hypothetical protein PK156_42025, partial [Polyangium sp.]|nr:hypothetical protein [Polyangium sp.]
VAENMFRNMHFVSTAILVGATVGFSTVDLHAETPHVAQRSTEPWDSRGFVLGARFGVTPMADEAFTSMGFSLGYKFGKTIVQLTGAFQDIRANGFSMQGFTGISYDYDERDFVARPEVQFAYAQFPQKRLELIGQMGCGLGGQLNISHSEVRDGLGTVVPTVNTQRSVLVDTHIATGSRFWPHSQFAASVVGGIEFAARIPTNLNSKRQTSFSPRFDVQFLAVF